MTVLAQMSAFDQQQQQQSDMNDVENSYIQSHYVIVFNYCYNKTYIQGSCEEECLGMTEWWPDQQ